MAAATICFSAAPLSTFFASRTRAPFLRRPSLTAYPSIFSPFYQKGQATIFSSNALFPLISTSASATSSPKQRTFESDVGESKAGIIRRIFLGALVWKALTFLSFLGSSACLASANDSIRASSLGLKVAMTLRKLGWPDWAVVFSLATLPVLELRGAIPVGYWMQLDPLYLTVLSILGNMVPVPFIVLYLKKLASFLSQKSPFASKIFNLLFERARDKAGPVEEFRWLGLMLFVAVPFPGTGAWTGAIISSILDMPFWSALSANFFGVVLAGLLVNLLMNLGMKYAFLTGLLLFLVSTIMWSVLRSFKKSLDS